MNRAERRRQQHQQRKTGRSVLSPTLHTKFREAVTHQQQGRLSQAKQLYQAILSEYPRHADALHLLGLIAYREREWADALTLINKAIEVDPHKPLYYFNQGLTWEKCRQPDQAIRAYQQATSLKPDYVEAYTNLGNVFRSTGDLHQAVQAYQRAIAIQPTYADGHNNLGVAHKEQGQLQAAESDFLKAIALNPRHAEAHVNLGMTLQEQGKVEPALISFEEAIHIKPGYAKAYHCLGLTALCAGQPARALEALRRSADLLHNHGQLQPRPFVYKARVKHEVEQLSYLQDRGLLHEVPPEYPATFRQIQQRVLTSDSQSAQIAITRAEYENLAPSFNRILHYADCPTVPGAAINPNLNVEDIETRYLGQSPEMLVVDSLLTPDALRALRQFCLESTIWKKDYENGYIGAMFGEGFSCPLLLQISEELRTRFPNIFRHHRLVQSWAFKQDSQLRGLNIHADAAAVNVNFWITPDEANTDPTSGGLVVWDKEAPPDWNFTEYNSTAYKGKIHDFLQSHGARPVTIPYRENRAVIFNSDLFHETDRCAFKEGYENRRVNVTMLYGYRLKE